MKKLIQKQVTVLILYFLTQSIHAQDAIKLPSPYVAPGGYWVVEQKSQPHSGNLVKFYNSSSELMHSETIPGRKLNLHNTRVKLKLEYALNQIIKVYARQRNTTLEENYVAALFRKI